MKPEKVKKILGKQLELLAEKSKDSMITNHDLAELSSAMINVVEAIDRLPIHPQTTCQL